MKLEQLCNYDNIETALSICNIDYTRIKRNDYRLELIFYSPVNYKKFKRLIYPHMIEKKGEPPMCEISERGKLITGEDEE